MQHPFKQPPERFNFAQHILETNRGRAGKPAYIDDRETLSYGDLDQRVRRFAAGLLALGLRPEERVLVIMHDTTDMPVALLGAMYAGIVPVPVNTLLPAPDYAYMLGHCGARVVLASAALLPVVQEAIAQSGRKPQLVVSGD
ncbi:MAG: AMP-binding protein, partial [Burkholderiaceae bacterium]